jgi:autotransporter-associated beta strand protein
MRSPARFTRAFLSLLGGTALALVHAPGDSLRAATVRWTAGGASGLWSDAANWSTAGIPVDGDDLVFGHLASAATSVLDLSRSFASLSFDSDASPFALHVQGGGALLSFTGQGIRNLSAGSAPIRQDLLADAGVAGGTLRFTASSGINVAAGEAARPVNLTALGGAAVGDIGGHIVFQDQAAAGTVTFDALRAEGATALGATGGEIVLTDHALVGRNAGVTVSGGGVAGAVGAQASFQGFARMEGTLNVLAGSNGGLGARAAFAGSAAAAATVGITHQGATSAAAGAEGATVFSDDARLSGASYNGAGQVAGAAGGLLEFRGRASHDTSALGPTLGMVQITNVGAAVAGARGGRLVFRDDASVTGMQLRIDNRAEAEGAAPGSAGGSTEFQGRSLAGRASIHNEGAYAGGAAVGGSTSFGDQASAQGASITSTGGGVAGAAGGVLRFSGEASAGSATIDTQGGRALDALGASTRFVGGSQAGSARIAVGGGTVSGAFGGTLDFADTTNAAHATVVNGAGQVAGAAGALTSFASGSGAGDAFISNDTAFGAGGGQGGRTVFADAATAQRASIDNHGGFTTSDGASTLFGGHASAANAVIVNFGGRQAGGFGGNTAFTGNATAGAATLVMAAGGAGQARGGTAVFEGDSSAGTAALDVRSATTAGAAGGQVYFYGRAGAGAARFVVEGSSIDHVLGPEGAGVTFANVASAEDAVFTVGGNRFAGGGVGRVQFTGASSAGRAALALAAGYDRGGAVSFEGADALNLASAADARITNQGSSAGAPRGLAIGGQTTFITHATAGRATITNQAGFGAGATGFFAASGAADAAIFNLGGVAGEDGGATQFNNTSSAQRAVIVNRAGAIGTAGFDAAGVTRFTNQASAGAARITAEGAGASTAIGGLVSFGENANPGSATLVAEGGTQGGAGGRIQFTGLTNSSTARVVLNAGTASGGGGSFDISGLSAGVAGVAIGSVEGGGRVELGGKNLTLWAHGASTTFSGLVRDGGAGGSLTVTGGATLTLEGANTYGGGTRIGDGLTPGSGKLIAANASGSATGSGPVDIEFGGTLGGGGYIDGPVTLHAGGLAAPGDPVTLTLRNSLTWDGGGVIRLVLGADTAGSDHLNIGSLIRGAAGAFTFELVDAGMVVGQAYDLMSFGTLVGFSASDFTVVGAGGAFSLDAGRLGFSVTAVPEPGTTGLFAIGLCCLAWLRYFHPRTLGRSIGQSPVERLPLQ